MNKAYVHHHVSEGAGLEKSEGQRRVLDSDQEESVRIEVQEEEKMMVSTQEEVVQGCKEVERFESQEVLNENLANE